MKVIDGVPTAVATPADGAKVRSRTILLQFPSPAVAFCSLCSHDTATALVRDQHSKCNGTDSFVRSHKSCRGPRRPPRPRPAPRWMRAYRSWPSPCCSRHTHMASNLTDMCTNPGTAHVPLTPLFDRDVLRFMTPARPNVPAHTVRGAGSRLSTAKHTLLFEENDCAVTRFDR